MKANATKALLLIAAIAVWAAVLWKAFKKPEAAPALSNAAPAIATGELTHDAYQELKLARDPFLDEAGQQRMPLPISTANAPRPTLTAPRHAAPVELKPKAWPSIAYKGMVRDQKSGETVAFMVVNGRERMLKSGDGWEDLRLEAVTADSLVIARLDGSRWVAYAEAGKSTRKEPEVAHDKSR